MTEQDPAALGRAIQERREELGFSRPELARLADLSYPYLYEVERGKKSPSREAFARIAEGLEIAQEELEARAAECGGAEPLHEDVRPLTNALALRADPHSAVADPVERIVRGILRGLEPIVRDAVQTAVRETR